MTIRTKSLAACWFALAALETAIAPAAAQAQAEGRLSYDLPAQELAQTLRAIAQLSHVEILFADAAVKGRRGPPLHGTMSASQAVRAAIAGTDLVVEQREGALLVRAGGPGASNTIDPASEVAEVTITGTRIRGAGVASPLIVATRQSLEEAGLSDMAGFSRALPQNFTGGQNPGVAGGGDQGGQNNLNNSTTLNLRGLGPDATLTLINSHRLAYDALNQGIDIAAIPLAAIERIEVIPDGASALYGSDAVGGVVNVRLRRDFAGAQLSARFGAATDGGDVQQQYDAVTGMRWESGGFMVAGDYAHATPVRADQRDYTRKLSGSQMLLAGQSQASAVIAGHQRIAPGISFEFDGEYADRHARKTNAFTTTSDASVNGLINRPSLRSYALSPTLRAELPAGWEASLEATRSVSRTDIHSDNFRNGTDTPGRLTYDNHLTNIEAGGEGPLFAPPGGAVRLAAGGGYRTFLLDIHTTQTVGGIARTTRDASERRESLFAYGELSVPLVGASNAMPLVEELRLSAAARYERYRGIDAVGTPKLGLVYAPVGGLRFKFSWGRSFKIPTLNQINQVPSAALLPASLFAPQPTPPLPAGATVLFVGGGNEGLKAERATTWTATFELTPRLIEGLSVQASYFNVDYRDRIGSPISDILSSLANPAFSQFVELSPSASQVLEIVDSLPQALSNQSGQPFDPAQVGAIVDARLRNAARERAHGVDLTAEYQTDLGPDEHLLLTAATSYLDASRQLSAGQVFLPQSGVIFTPPHWRARAGASWTRATVQLSGFLNYLGANSDDRLAAAPVEIEPFTTLDLSARVRTGADAGAFHGIEVRLSALNVLNEKPDRIRTSDPAAIPYDSTNQSAIGRFVSLAVTKSW